MNFKEHIRNHPALYMIIMLILGLGLGAYLFGGNEGPSEDLASSHDHAANELYTCSMHPQIRLDEPGACPICGMDLIVLSNETVSELPADGLVFSEAAIRLAEIETSVITKGQATKEVYLPGRVVADERRVSEITAHFPGRIEELYLNYTGQVVRKGQVLAVVYAPELVSAQKELFEAYKMQATNPQLYKATRNKFKRWEFTDKQIDNMEHVDEVQYNFEILSHISGTVVKRNVAEGDHIMEGLSMFQVVDLSKVWVLFDVYESDLPFVHQNDEVEITFNGLPEQGLNSKVSFVEPLMDEVKRTTVVRVEVINHDGRLKPGMLANGRLKSRLGSTTSNYLMVPKSAVLWTGKRAIVYVKDNTEAMGSFTYREITLGEETADSYIVLAGLKEGEEVASNGVFKIDAAAQLKGLPSMMN
jgi:Cu(I)/Ag(I) efflux system membrane fusion protein